MAAAVLQQELKCSICLNIYCEPTTLPCGHTFCKKCIQKTFQTSLHQSCPECRHRLPLGMELNRNTKMCSIVEQLTSTKPKSAKSQGGCSYCDGTAEKLCLDCETPLCCDHLKKHKESVEHVLTDLHTTLQSRKCPVHQELLKYHCMEEGVNICASCGLIGEHQQHKVEKLRDLSAKEKSALKILEDLLSCKKAEIEKKVGLVRSHKDKVGSNTRGMRNMVTGVIGDMKKELESLERQVLCQVTIQEDQILSQVSQFVKTLEVQISQIDNQIKEIQNLCETTDPLTLLEGKALSTNKANALIQKEDDSYVGNVDVGTILVTLLSCIRRFTKRLPFLLKNRGFHTEDASSRLLPLSQILDAQNHGPQFIFSPSTISTGQHYWQVETGDKPCWAVGVSYHNEVYKAMGYNTDSWCLSMTHDKQYKAVHDGQEVMVVTNGPLKTLGVYLEYEGGSVSFCQVSNDTVRYLGSMHAKFTQPLHIVMYVERGGWIRVRK